MKEEENPTPEEELPLQEETPTEAKEEEPINIEEELKAAQNKYVLLLAESENARKRMQKERQDLTKYAVEGALVEFLHPLDSFEKALNFAENMSDEVKNWAIGFEMIIAQLKQVLSNHGVVEYHSIGKPFDPHLHEAVEMIETDDYEPGVVVEEFVRGYKVGERPVRVARVKVAKAPEKENKEDSEKS